MEARFSSLVGENALFGCVPRVSDETGTDHLSPFAIKIVPQKVIDSVERWLPDHAAKVLERLVGVTLSVMHA